MKKKTRSARTVSPATTDVGKVSPDDSGASGSFPIVGIGASAGGLEAFSALLRHLPLDTGMGFVLVQHLDPEHDSALAQLLGRATSLPVLEVTHNLRVEPNHVYVIPPNAHLSIAAGVLILTPRPKTRTPHRSIDFFLDALAKDRRERAIGVILSGTATDGTLGLDAIKAEGGITFAQDDSARYDSMPRSAVASGSVDFVLSPADIAAELARIAKHPVVAGGTRRAGAKGAPAEAARGRQETIGARIDDGFKAILLLLRNYSSVDFSLYKSTTIQRRIRRRMVLTKHDTPERYAHFLKGNSHELGALYADVLISVTSFFRNPDAFDVLRRKVWPALLEQRGDEPLRVWTLGCSTGQEAYSIAMSFVEAADKAPRMRKLQIFATDLNETLLDKARHGLYAKNLVQDLSRERLRRFFVEEGGGYRVNKALREMIVFARQNVITDPPFSRLDIISCRNLFIYFESGLQRRIMPVFHYALKPGGFLYLGASESVAGFTELFEPLDKKQKIYVKRAALTPAFRLPAQNDRGNPSNLSQPGRGLFQRPADHGAAADVVRGELSARREADRVAVNQFAPPAVLINADLQIVQFRGATGAYLEPPTGAASFDVLKMARPGLVMPLRGVINKAKSENTTARKEHVRIEDNGKSRTVNVEVIPLKNLRDRCFLVVFEDADKAATAGSARGTRRLVEPPPGREDRAVASRRNAALEAELAEMRDYVQSIQEQHEASNEELQASNEEVQSGNEELQSINEELETSKEELESANEELTTLNEEMASRHAELNRLNSDLVNIQTSAHQAIVLLGRDLTIRRFSIRAEKQLNLLSADVGRPIGHIRHNLDVPDLESFITEVIDHVRPREREVRDSDGRWFSLRVRPYLTVDNTVDGAVLMLVDIDDLKRSELSIASAREYAENIIGTVREPLLVLNADLRVESVNRAFYRTFGVAPGDTIGKFIYELGNRQWDIPEFRTLLEDVLSESQTIEDFLVDWDFELLGRRSMLLNARRMHSREGGQGRIVVAIEDITERKRNEERYRTLFSSIDEGFCVIEKVDAHAGAPLDFRYVEVNPAFTTHTGVSDVVGRTIRQAFPHEPEEWFHTYDHVLSTGEPTRFERGLVSQGRVLELYAFRIEDRGQQRVAVIFKDISERKRSEEALRDADRRKNEFLAMLAHELRSPLAPIMLSIDILRRAAGAEVSDHALEVLQRQVEQMVRLVDDLLDAGRISRGKIDLRRERVEIASVVNQAVDAVRPITDRRNQTLTVTLPSVPVYMDADPARLIQVVGNLLNNACKFTDVGGHIWLTVERAEDVASQAVIRVRDTGIGIRADQLPRIFDMFTQVDASLERSLTGLGIGLTLVKTITEMHGGTVTVSSAGVGEGSEFVVRLPMAAENDAPAAQPAATESTPATPLRILVVDDNRDLARALSRLLQFAGHETFVAHDGWGAVEAAAKIDPDVIFLDIGLPVLNGYEAARRIRAIPGQKRRPILVALTGWGQDEARQRSEEAGFDAHVVKPIGDAVIRKLLATLTASRQ